MLYEQEENLNKGEHDSFLPFKSQGGSRNLILEHFFLNSELVITCLCTIY